MQTSQVFTQPVAYNKSVFYKPQWCCATTICDQMQTTNLIQIAHLYVFCVDSTAYQQLKASTTALQAGYV